ncbi:hypothetical protein AWX17_27385 [Priestia megaterium]|nr:hypothetical protein AWX17_27385 [Priestia megaterium]
MVSGGSGSPLGGGVDEDRPIVVMASGSLAHLYLRDAEGIASRDAVDARYPLLVQGLAQHPHIGLVVTHAEGGLRVDGATGWRLLGPGSGEVLDGSGIDPLLDYGPFAADDVRDVATRAHAGDLVVMGRYDADLDEVVAFEELVGSHGGMGGGQTEAVFLHPSNWRVDRPALRGRDVHDILVGRLAEQGLRFS